MPVMPGVTWRPVPSHSGLMSEHRGLVLHVQVGDNSCYGEFSNPANQASSTWWVPKSGTVGDLSPIEQYVDSDYAAWTEAAGNYTWDSVETEGTPDEPLTDYQVWAVGQIFAWGHDEYGWPYQLSEKPATAGLGWHGMGGAAWGGHYGCPGELRKAQRPAILAAAQGHQEDDLSAQAEQNIQELHNAIFDGPAETPGPNGIQARLARLEAEVIGDGSIDSGLDKQVKMLRRGARKIAVALHITGDIEAE